MRKKSNVDDDNMAYGVVISGGSDYIPGHSTLPEPTAENLQLLKGKLVNALRDS